MYINWATKQFLHQKKTESIINRSHVFSKPRIILKNITLTCDILAEFMQPIEYYLGFNLIINTMIIRFSAPQEYNFTYLWS